MALAGALNATVTRNLARRSIRTDRERLVLVIAMRRLAVALR